MSVCSSNNLPKRQHQPKLSSLSLASRTLQRAWFGRVRAAPYRPQATKDQDLLALHSLLLAKARKGSARKGLRQVQLWLVNRIRTEPHRFLINNRLSQPGNHGVHQASVMQLPLGSEDSSKNTTTFTTHQEKRISGSASFVNTRVFLDVRRKPLSDSMKLRIVEKGKGSQKNAVYWKKQK